MSVKQEHIPVFYEGQDDLVDILATSMASVCYNTKSFIEFYILDCGICDFNKKLLENMNEKFNNFSIKFIPINLTQFAGLRGWGSGNFVDCYSRLLIPDLKLNYDKVIYLDTDMIALDDIKKLYDIELEDYPYAATPELGCNDYIFNNCINNLGIDKKHIYPSAGMLVLNLKKIKSSEKLIKICREYNDKLIVFNEEIFSIAFGCNNYKKLDLRFNMADRISNIKNVNAPEITDEYVENEFKHIVLQHLTPTKPWKFLYSENRRPLRNIWAFWHFAKMTPFYEGMQNRYLWFMTENIVYNTMNTVRYKSQNIVKLFGFIPMLSVHCKGNKRKYKLFNLIPLLTIKEK